MKCKYEISRKTWWALVEVGDPFFTVWASFSIIKLIAKTWTAKYVTAWCHQWSIFHPAWKANDTYWQFHRRIGIDHHAFTIIIKQQVHLLCFNNFYLTIFITGLNNLNIIITVTICLIFLIIKINCWIIIAKLFTVWHKRGWRSWPRWIWWWLWLGIRCWRTIIRWWRWCLRLMPAVWWWWWWCLRLMPAVSKHPIHKIHLKKMLLEPNKIFKSLPLRLHYN